MLEEGIAGVREIDLGLMMGTGMVPGPFARADFRGLDDVLAALEQAEQEWGEHFAPPLVLRRLVAQGRLGAKSRPGLLPLPAARARLRDRGRQARPPRRRHRRAVARQPAGELALAAGARGARAAWNEVEGTARAVIVASPNPALFCAGADIKAFTQMDEAAGAEMVEPRARAAALLRQLAHDDDRRRQRHGARRRLRAGDGLRRAPRGVLGVVRPAGDQPRDHPGLRRDPAAAAARRPGEGAGDEHDRRPDRRRGGLRVRPRQPRRGRPRAVRHRARLGAQARAAGAARARADQAGLGRRRPRRGPRGGEGGASPRSSRPRTRREGISAFLGKRTPRFKGA